MVLFWSFRNSPVLAALREILMPGREDAKFRNLIRASEATV